jgi:phosphate acetyltransferase
MGMTASGKINMIENKTFDEIKVGDSASLKRVLTQKDIELFAIMSGDINPAHVDAQYAKDDRFHKIVAHGMWGGALISAVLGTELPGPGTIYLHQTLDFLHPIALGDEISICITATKKNTAKKIIEFNCQCVNQHKDIVISGIAIVMTPIEKIKRARIELPEVELKYSEDHWYHQLIKLKDNFAPLKTAVVHPVDKLSLQGAAASAEAGLIIPVLVGPKDKILSAAKEADIDISPYELISTQHSQEAAEKAVDLARTHKIEALMKGKIHTDELMKAVIDKEKGLRTGRRMSHIFAMDINNYPKPLFLTDTAINISPNLDAKRDIVQNAIDLYIALGLGTPKVAIVSAVETVNEKIPSTLDATALCKMAEREQITGGILDGPLGFDMAISRESANVKGIHSQVAGDADIIIVPDVESGNMLYKQMTYLSGRESAGIVLGAKVPIILTSRGSDVISRKASSALALCYVRKRK